MQVHVGHDEYKVVKMDTCIYTGSCLLNMYTVGNDTQLNNQQQQQNWISCVLYLYISLPSPNIRKI